MLLPDKHITFAESLLGLGSFIIENLQTPSSIDNLWRAFEKQRGSAFPAYHSFDNMVLAADFLYALGAIEETQEGLLMQRIPEKAQCDS